jgi:hypothetical protein
MDFALDAGLLRSSAIPLAKHACWAVMALIRGGILTELQGNFHLPSSLCHEGTKAK